MPTVGGALQPYRKAPAIQSHEEGWGGEGHLTAADRPSYYTHNMHNLQTRLVSPRCQTVEATTGRTTATRHSRETPVRGHQSVKRWPRLCRPHQSPCGDAASACRPRARSARYHGRLISSAATSIQPHAAGRDSCSAVDHLHRRAHLTVNSNARRHDNQGPHRAISQVPLACIRVDA